MATLDDLVNVLTSIADKLDLVNQPTAMEIKVQRRAQYEALVKRLMLERGLDEAAAKALIEQWKTEPLP